MPRSAFIETAEDVQWLKDTTLKGVPLPANYAEFKSAILQGNEDAPHAVNLYKAEKPNHDDDFYRVRFDDDGFTYCTCAEYNGKTGVPHGGLSSI